MSTNEKRKKEIAGSNLWTFAYDDVKKRANVDTVRLMDAIYIINYVLEPTGEEIKLDLE